MNQYYIAIPVILVALLTGCSRDEAAASGSTTGAVPIRVVAREIHPQPLVDAIQALGTANANESVEIKPRIASVVAAIRFEEDQVVEQGDLLVELENSEIVAELAVARAELKESRSIFNRNRSLKDTQAISAANFEQLEAKLQVDEARVKAAEARLAHTYIRSPFSGKIGLRRVSPGSFVDSSTVITTLDDTRHIKLDFSIPETFIVAVHEGMGIEAASPAYPGRTFKGQVASVDTRLDPVTRSIGVRALLPNPDGALKPGMFLTVDLQQVASETLLVPEESIVPEGDRQFIYVVEKGVASKREVTLGRRVPSYVEILSNLTPGEVIVTEGTLKLRDGTAVEVEAPSAAVTAGSDSDNEL